MISWYGYSLAALLLLGSQRFLYKVAAHHGFASSRVTTVFMATVTLLSGGLYLTQPHALPSLYPLLTLSLANSLSFTLSTMANIEALRHLSAGIIFPLTRLSLACVVAVSLIWFDETLNSGQWLGMILAFSVIYLLSQEARFDAASPQALRRGLGLVLVCILCGTVASVSSKLAAVSTDKAAFMALSYLVGTLFSSLTSRVKQSAHTNQAWWPTVALGGAMGVLNFLGFYAFLTALETGPLSAIILITGMHFIIAMTLSVLIYRESVTWRRVAAMLLTVATVVLLKV
nr:DMT family transporter [uncultured Desulfuromonas sp.]